MAEKFDIIVIGVGSMGAAACYELLRREPSLRVLGLEQFEIPNARGSHHGHCRAFRTAYFEHADYVALLRRALELWREIEAEAGASLLHLTGGLYMGRPDSALVRDSISAARLHHVPHTLLSRAELAARFPQFCVDDDAVGFFEEQVGYVLCEKAVHTYANAARQRGAELHERERVQSWRAGSSGVSVSTDRANYDADHLIIAAGPWAGRMVAGLGVELKVTRQVAGWFRPVATEPFASERFPVWGIDPGVDGRPCGIWYGFPPVPERPGLKIAHHWPGELCDPDTVDRSVTPQETTTLREAMGRYLPQGRGELLAAQVCLYTNSPDGHFIIDRHPDPALHKRVTIACGFSGHGFKFVSVIGKALAELVLEGKSNEPIDFLGLGRFGIGGDARPAAEPRGR